MRPKSASKYKEKSKNHYSKFRSGAGSKDYNKQHQGYSHHIQQSSMILRNVVDNNDDF
jgi:hypothetical protein